MSVLKDAATDPENDVETALTALVPTLDQPDRLDVIKKLFLSARSASVVPLTNALEHESRLVRERTAELLGELGAVAKAAVPALQARANMANENVMIREAARQAIAKIRSDSS